MIRRWPVTCGDDWLDEASSDAVRKSLRRCLECIDVTWDGDYILCASAQEALALFYLGIDKAIASALALWDLVEEDSFDEDIAFELI